MEHPSRLRNRARIALQRCPRPRHGTTQIARSAQSLEVRPQHVIRPQRFERGFIHQHAIRCRSPPGRKIRASLYYVGTGIGKRFRILRDPRLCFGEAPVLREIRRNI